MEGEELPPEAQLLLRAILGVPLAQNNKHAF